jgi:hypothetical protein
MRAREQARRGNIRSVEWGVLGTVCTPYGVLPTSSRCRAQHARFEISGLGIQEHRG